MPVSPEKFNKSILIHSVVSRQGEISEGGQFCVRGIYKSDAVNDPGGSCFQSDLLIKYSNGKYRAKIIPRYDDYLIVTDLEGNDVDDIPFTSIKISKLKVPTPAPH